MIFALFIVVVSLGGIVWILRTHESDLLLLEEQLEHQGKQPSFALFMQSIEDHFATLWHAHTRDRALVLIEKLLRRFRIVVLKVERLLFRALHRVRDAVQKHNDNSDA